MTTLQIGLLYGGATLAALFSPATCSATGNSGIPEMRRCGYSPGFAVGLAAGGTLGILLPPSIVLILYAVAAEQSLGRLFLAGVGPGVLLVALFAGYAVLRWKQEFGQAAAADAAGGAARSEILRRDSYTWADRLAALPRVLPFLVLPTGVMVAPYGGIATPSETAGLGAVLALLLIALIYGAFRLRDLKPIFMGTLGESGMLLMSIGMSLLYSYVMSYLHISQAAAGWIVGLHLSKWLLLLAILSAVPGIAMWLPDLVYSK